MDEVIFSEILGKLDGLNYFFTSGLSVSIYTNGKRIPGDIDVVVHPKDVDVFARRLGAIAEIRKINKGMFKVTSYGFEVDYKGQIIECTAGHPLKKIKAQYLNFDVYTESLEELINRKAFMRRKKDLKDLESLKDKIIDKDLLLKISKEKGNADIVLPTISKYFKLKFDKRKQ
jgi:hypothetical protein